MTKKSSFISQVPNQNLHSAENIDYIMRLAANGEFDRWGVLNKLYKYNIILKKHAGIGSISYKNTGAFRQVSEFVVQDYEGTSFDIDYKSYLDYLLKLFLKKIHQYNSFDYLNSKQEK